MPEANIPLVTVYRESDDPTADPRAQKCPDEQHLLITNMFLTLQ